MSEQSDDGKSEWGWKPNEISTSSDYYLGFGITATYLRRNADGELDGGSRMRDMTEVILVKTDDGMYRIIPVEEDEDEKFDECGPWEDEEEARIRYFLMTTPVEYD